MMAQDTLVLQHLKDYRARGITQAEALGLYSVWRLASRIHTLRSSGFRITAERKHDRNGKRYTRYRLKMKGRKH